MFKYTILIISLASTITFAGNRKMNPEKMLATINKIGQNISEKGNVIEFLYKKVPLVLVYDINADRMRLVSPIIEVKDIDEEILHKAMEANFHSALDARYAISNGVVWSAFIHPMSELSKNFFKSAIDQVATAHLTFGSQYSSGSLIFGGGE